MGIKHILGPSIAYGGYVQIRVLIRYESQGMVDMTAIWMYQQVLYIGWRGHTVVRVAILYRSNFVKKGQ